MTSDELGLSTLEYGLIAGLIALAIVIVVSAAGGSLTSFVRDLTGYGDAAATLGQIETAAGGQLRP